MDIGTCPINANIKAGVGIVHKHEGKTRRAPQTTMSDFIQDCELFH